MALAKKTFSIEIGGKPLILEFSSLAEQANAAVVAKYGETVVLVTAVMSHHEVALDYMPLKVDYEERFYAAGKIIGSRYVRREGRPSEEAILGGRLIDRTIRPLFDAGLRRELQVVVTILAYDEEHEPEFVGLIAASAALAISNIPWGGPVAGVKIARRDGKLLINPKNSELKDQPDEKSSLADDSHSLEAFVAGVKDRINMIEFAGNEAPEEDIVAALAQAQKEINRLVEFQNKIVSEIGQPKTEVALFAVDPTLQTAVLEFLAPGLEAALYQKDKKEQHAAMRTLKQEMHAHLAGVLDKPDPKAIEHIYEEAVDALVHKNILESDRRPDGRALDEVRQLGGEVGLFQRTHGSALFVRGNTQALAVTTLAPPGAEQLIETMETTGKRRFMLHYNFPPYSVGEVGNFRGPGRREIGHGALAEKAIRPLLPPQSEFPYTIRLVSEIVSSNGSSSMATVCAGILSLMDAGVPIKKPAAGIAMGLMLEQNLKSQNPKSSETSDLRYKILTDIQGPEDHYGDMDFKAAGTDAGVNAIQMDVKVSGVTLEMVAATLAQAKAAREHILKFMSGVLAKPNPQLSPYVPSIMQIAINPDKIGAVIGPGGKVINGMIARMGLTSIDIEEDGRVFVSAMDPKQAELAIAEIRALTKEYKVGEIVEGKVIKILDFGAIVDLGGGKDGMIHVSELKNGFVKVVTEVVKQGDFVRAKIIRVDADGHIGLSLKQLENG